MTKSPIAAANDLTIGGPAAWLDQTPPLPTLLSQVSATGSLAGPATGIPAGQSIRGLKAEFDFSDIEGDGPFSVTFSVSKKNAGACPCFDLAARLVIGGVTQTTDAAKAGNWPASLASFDYTFTGLSKADVASIGLSLAATSTPSNKDTPPRFTPQVDVITATVTAE